MIPRTVFHRPAEVTEYLAEKLQQAFINPWQEVYPTNVPDFQTVSHLLKDVPPPTPSVGQVKSTLRHLNPKKATGADGIPAWLLKRFYQSRSPSLRSSGRNARLWDNPFQGGI
jgi:hypothetical protein